MLSASPVLFVIPGDMPPAKTVKLIFIHHSTGGYWLADSEGNEIGSELGKALKKNNYFTGATNYDWALTVLVVYRTVRWESGLKRTTLRAVVMKASFSRWLNSDEGTILVLWLVE